MIYRYIPMLKTKAGEVVALDNLVPAIRSRVLPLLHMGENLSASFGIQMAKAWGSQLIVIDGSFNFMHSGSVAAFQGLVFALRNAGTPAIPSVGYSDPQAYVQAAGALKNGNGIIVKVSLGHLASVFGWIAQHGWSLDESDLVIDLKHIASIDHATYAGYVLSLLQQCAQGLAMCRSVTLASGAAPKDHSSLRHGPNRLPREDWRLWSAVHSRSPVQLDYGDYCTGHPDLTEPRE